MHVWKGKSFSHIIMGVDSITFLSATKSLLTKANYIHLTSNTYYLPLPNQILEWIALIQTMCEFLQEIHSICEEK